MSTKKRSKKSKIEEVTLKISKRKKKSKKKDAAPVEDLSIQIKAQQKKKKKETKISKEKRNDGDTKKTKKTKKKKGTRTENPVIAQEAESHVKAVEPSLSQDQAKNSVHEKVEDVQSGDGGNVVRSFRRVADEDWLNKQGAWNNSYSANFGKSGWGAKAQAVLGQVRGKNFRHEKTKKKRGTYFGGKISTHKVNSIKFESDDET